MRQKYMSCLGGGCVPDDDDFDGGYSRLDPGSSGDGDGISMGERQGGGGRTEDDYFRPPGSYQWNQSDNDQGQEPMVVDQGSLTYTGVQIETKKDKKKMAKKTIGKRIRHFLRVSFKWMRRGFFAASPAATPHIMMNPAAVMTSAIGRQITNSNKPMVYL